MDTIVLWLIVIALLPIVMVLLNELVIRNALDVKRPWLGGPQIISASLIVTAAVASIVYEALFAHGLAQTAALFVGIPTILALATMFVPTASAHGVAVKSVTIGLLFSLLFLKEGVICVLMSAPLFYVIALLVGSAAEGLNKPNDRGRYFSSVLFLAAIGPMSLEGVTPLTTISRGVTVTDTRIVNASAATVAHAIQQQPRFDRPLPRFLSIGFPRPTSTKIDGDTWIIRMRGGELRLNGMEPRAGDLVLTCDGRGENFLSWRSVSDDSHMTHFLNWETSRVEWTAIDAQTTRVTWTLRYRRGLDPAWYFGPMERYAMTLAAGYLIDAVATP